MIPPGSLPPERVALLTHPTMLAQFLAQLDARLNPTDRVSLHRRASLLRGLGRWGEAAEAYRALLDLDPQDWAAQTGAAIFMGQPVPPEAVGPTPFVQIEDALSSDQQALLWQALAAETNSLRPAGVYGREPGEQRIDPSTRRADRLETPEAIRAWFLPWLEALIEQHALLPRLGLAPFPVGTRELQVTRHGDGGFFSVHTDAAATPDRPTWARHLTFIYYFHRLPRCFTGGDLLLFDAAAGGDLSFTRIDPTHNSLVLFQSTQLHTVTRVHCPSDDPLDGRWTVNGWLHRRVGA